MGVTFVPSPGPRESTSAHASGPPLRLRRRLRRHPYFLEAFSWAYLTWSMIPIAIAVMFSFNSGKSTSAWQGFSLRWYLTDPNQSVLHNSALHAAVIQTLRLGALTTAIAVPLGLGFAIGIDRWRSRTSTGLNFVMILSFVVPELLLAVALMFVFTQLFTFVRFGTLAEVLALVVWNVSWPAIMVRARLLTIGRVYEEAAADLGASRLSAIRRVLLPMLAPAIFASGVLVFASVIDDFVIVEQLSSSASTQSMAVVIYSNVHGGLAGPALNALATLMLAFSVILLIIGWAGYRFMTRGERRSGGNVLTQITGVK